MKKDLLACFRILVIVVSCSMTMQAQVYSGVNQSDISRELKKRNIKESELRSRAEASGINIDSVVYFSPLQIKTLESIIVDLESEKALKATDSIPRTEYLSSVVADSIPEILEEVDVDTQTIAPAPTRYGQSVFRDRTIQVYKDVQGVKAPSGYLLGPGDELSLSIFGKSNLDEKHTIANDGYIRVLNGRVKVFLKGLTLDQARTKLIATLRNNYSFSTGQFDLSLSYSRTVQVNVYGEVYKPGPVTLSALNDAFSALAASEGPTDIGSLRKIQLIRADGSKEEMDIYAYLNNPKPKSKFYLQDGDVILVPPAQNIVVVDGAVRRPFEYEMLDSETVSNLITYSGGFNGNANKDILKLSRYEDSRLRTLDVNLKQGGGSRLKLMNGDSLFVNTLDSLMENFIAVEGAVFQEGKYEYKEGMRVSDLISKAQIKPEARTDIAFLQRVNRDSTYSYEELDLDMIIKDADARDNIYLQEKDKLTIWYLKSFSDQSVVKISGAIRSEGEIGYDVSNNVQLREAILLSGGLRRDASDMAIIHRKDPLNPKLKKYVTITNLSEIINGSNANLNVELSPFDSIYVYSEEEFLDEAGVSIEGAVNYPGEYQYGVDMTIKDLLVLAGGVKMNAALNRVEVSRVVIEDNKPTTINIANVSIDKNYNIVGGNPSYSLKPFDVVHCKICARL